MEYILENMKPRCGAIVQRDGSVRWLVWAPKADHVEVVLIEGDTRTLHAYHVDGLRLDAVHAIYDFGARHILQDI